MSSKMTPDSLEKLLVAQQRKVSQLERRLGTLGGIPAGWNDTINEADRFFNLSRVAQDYSADALDLTPLLQPPFFQYTALVKTLGAEYFSQPSATLSKYGWVSMRGIIKQSAATTANALIFTLPPGWRPQQAMMFPTYAIDSGIGVQGITVYPNGEVRMAVAPLINTEHSLAHIFFNVNAYTPLTLIPPWASLTPATFGPAAIYKSPDGLVGLAGGVTGGTVSSSAFLLPAGYEMALTGSEIHLVSASASGNFAYGNVSAVANAYRPRVTADQHLSGARWIAAGSPLLMLTATTILTNGWTNYGGAFPVAQATKTQDGVVTLNGLINTGSAPNPAFTLPPGWRPRKNLIFSSVGNDAMSRVDVGWDGVVQPVFPSGVIAWRSLDGITFQAEPSP